MGQVWSACNKCGEAWLYGVLLWDKCCSCFGASARATKAEVVWMALQATRREGERHPRVGDMVREVERMTGVATEDVAAAQVLNMARYLRRSPPPPNLIRIAQLVLDEKSPRLLLSRNGSLAWGRSRGDGLPGFRYSPWRIVGVVCVFITLELAARRTGTPWVAPLNYSSARALATALVALPEKGSEHGPNLFIWWSDRLMDGEVVPEVEVEVFYAALALNRSITWLNLPILLKPAKGEGPWSFAVDEETWGLDIVQWGHLWHMLSVNSTLKYLELSATYVRVPAEGGDDEVDAAVPTSTLLPPLVATWTNSTLYEFKFTIDFRGFLTRGKVCLKMDGAFEMIAQLQALRYFSICGNEYTSVAWSEKCFGLFQHRLTTTYTRTKLRFDPDDPDLWWRRSKPARLPLEFKVNATLRKLELKLDAHAREALFKALNPKQSASTTVPTASIVPNSWSNSVRELILHDAGEDTKEGEVEALATMLVNNNSFFGLHLCEAKYSVEQWATVIFPALAHNRTLTKLYTTGSPGVDSNHVYEAMLSMLQHNTVLHTIGLARTPLQLQGKDVFIEAQLQRNKDYRAALQEQRTMPVKSCRLVLCGYPFAGKSTLCEAIFESAISSTHNQHKATLLEAATGSVWALRAALANGSEPTKEEVVASRTRGFEVRLLHDEDNMRINVWDFAGQRHYYALHDFVFPSVNNSSLFLFVYSPVVHRHDPTNITGEFQYKGSHDFQMEFTYWLKFIASNSRYELDQTSKPQVLVAITFLDVLSQQNDLEAEMKKHELIEGFEELKRNFQRYIDVQGETPLFIDARCAHDACKVLLRVQRSLNNIVHNLPEVPCVCEKVRIALQDWCLAHPNQPIMTIAEFKQVSYSCKPLVGNAERLETQFFQHESSWQTVAFYFTDTGEIIYFRNMEFVVVNPHWLGRGVFGEMIDAFTPGRSSSEPTGMLSKFADNGFLKKDAWEKLLQLSLDKAGLQQQVVNGRQLSQLMLNLHICYERRNKCNVVEGYFVPVLLEIQGSHDGLDDLQRDWLSQTKDFDKCFFTGMRLQCSNDACTFLTPGFFPRLQVMLYNHYLENGFIGPGKQESRVKMDVELFAVTTLGFDILVEYSGSLGFHVDIMVKSIRPPLQTAEFVQKHVVRPIRLFCASQEGCMGVDLEEHVLSQQCVKRLTIRRYRKNQSIRTVVLMSRVKENGRDFFIQTWPRVAEDGMPDVCVPQNIQEYATIVNGHVILGSKTDMTGATSSRGPRPEVELEVCYPDINVKSGKRRGVAVLISRERYKNSGYRWGGPVDRGRLEALANSLKLDYDGNNFLDFGADSLRKELLDLAQDETRILPDQECLVCFVNAHGSTSEDGGFFFADCDGSRISLTDVVEPFRRCKNLVGKPKILFVNACRGGLKLRGMEDPVDGLGASEEQPIPSSWSEGVERRYVEQEADCLVVFSTSQHAASPRDVDHGTNFAYALVRAVNKYRESRDLLTIPTLLNYNVVYMEHEEVDAASGKVKILRQSPVFISSLRKLVYWRSS